MPDVETKTSFWQTPIGIWLIGAIMTVANALVMYVQTNNVGTAVVDTVKSKIEDSEQDVTTAVEEGTSEVIKEAEVVAEDLAPSVDDLKSKIEAMGQGSGATPQRGLINLDKLIPPEDRAKMYKAGVDTARIADAAEAIQAAVASINERLAGAPLEPTAAPSEELPPDPGPGAEGGPPQVPQQPQPWRPR